MANQVPQTILERAFHHAARGTMEEDTEIILQGMGDFADQALDDVAAGRLRHRQCLDKSWVGTAARGE